ncbi:DUF7282 domain-containing protein [Haloarchaeobius amylolyticus]|uniref:DUF7282 domain-containing protein n=1 Tax=Haloarchaeobius amylolyticus TaxID=1198296 RepID=UPI002270CAF1|nr:hypothetical protein [Haloarchaeobius amylolyticus]
MRQRITTLVVVAMLVSTGLAGTAAAGQGTTAADAAVQFSGQTSGGSTVVVDEVTLPEGGFVTIHDATLGDGKTLESVRGTSQYLEPGTHEDVTVHLDDTLSSDATLFAMAHQDTNDDRTYSFVASSGSVDGPYTAGGDIVMQSADVAVSATVSMADGPVANDTVVVDRVELSEGGFVTVHDATVTEGAVFESIRGTSQYLSAGVHENVRITLEQPLTENTTLVPMAHRDTDGDQTYTFDTSEGEADGPYTADGSAVVDTAAVTLADEATATFDAQAAGGHRVVVDSVFLPEGGFVTMHDASLQDGAVFDSVRGTSQYLAPGYHEDVAVVLDEPMTEDGSLIAMPHMDTDGDQAYDFVESEGGDDGPYTADGGAVVDAGNVTISASVSMADQPSDGHTVVVQDVDLSEGGFVTVHDSSLFAGATFDSVVGTSAYLEAGHHENVTVTLDSPIRSTQTLVPMAHQDTNDDQTYSFVEDEGGADGPYTADGGAVVDTARASVQATVTFQAQETMGETVVVDSVTLHDGGFVTIHDASLQDGAVFDSVRGTSAYLAPGTHENVTVTLDQPVEEDSTLIAMPHRDTNDDQTYAFVESEGGADGPYVANGAVVSGASVTYTGESMTETTMTTTMDEGTTMGEGTTMMDDGTGDDADSGGSPGFGIVAVALALVGTLAFGIRRAGR